MGYPPSVFKKIDSQTRTNETNELCIQVLSVCVFQCSGLLQVCIAVSVSSGQEDPHHFRDIWDQMAKEVHSRCFMLSWYKQRVSWPQCPETFETTTQRSAFSLFVYGVAMISRLLQIIGLFCRVSSLLQGSFAKETYNFKEPTHRRHPIWSWSQCPLHTGGVNITPTTSGTLQIKWPKKYIIGVCVQQCCLEFSCSGPSRQESERKYGRNESVHFTDRINFYCEGIDQTPNKFTQNLTSAVQRSVNLFGAVWYTRLPPYLSFSIDWWLLLLLVPVI